MACSKDELRDNRKSNGRKARTFYKERKKKAQTHDLASPHFVTVLFR